MVFQGRRLGLLHKTEKHSFFLIILNTSHTYTIVCTYDSTSAFSNWKKTTVLFSSRPIHRPMRPNKSTIRSSSPTKSGHNMNWSLIRFLFEVASVSRVHEGVSDYYQSRLRHRETRQSPIASGCWCPRI